MRFAQGELARLVVARTASGVAKLNSVVEILFVGPFNVGDKAVYGGVEYTMIRSGDYVIGGSVEPGVVMDWQLQKLNPGDEPKSLTRSKEETA